ncbi:MAG: alpha/beta hydrolase-fold protein [Candidatus Nanopelagicales bacterium]|jgi:enterochelin esterase-like enzyme|nr:alpha/beta hydrolase-fold protein [Candidatus Nanopelagicales bacterium]
MAIGRTGDDERPWRSTVTGRVDVTHVLHRGERRAVRTYLPPGYERDDRDHPVLVMFDGQNLFDRSTTAFGMEWGIDETVDALVTEGRIPGLVVVGIDSPQDPWGRYAEYTAWDWMLDGRPITADGAATADLLAEQVVPLVRRTYRVAQDRTRVGLAGSSMGGYMTLYAGLRHPALFGRLLAFSPVLLDEPMRGSLLRDHLVHTGFAPGTWVSLDMGGAEHLGYVDHPDRLVEDLEATAAACRASVRPPERLAARVVPGAAHDELAWGARFADVLLWAFFDGPEPASG